MQNINICLHWLRKLDATAFVFNARTQTFIKIHSLFPYNRPGAFMYPGTRLILVCRLFQFNKWPWQLIKVTGLEKLGGVCRVKCSFLASWLITSFWLLYFSMGKTTMLALDQVRRPLAQSRMNTFLGLHQFRLETDKCLLSSNIFVRTAGMVSLLEPCYSIQWRACCDFRVHDFSSEVQGDGWSEYELGMEFELHFERSRSG